MYDDLTPPHHPPKDVLLRSWLGSLAVGMPSLFAAIALLKTTPMLEEASLLSLTILAMACGNFVALLAIEKHREMLGKLTIHALVCTIGVVFLYVMIDAMNRFVVDLGFHWLYPAVLAGLSVVYIALFREPTLWIKLLLAVNGVMLAVLWCLGATQKVALPF